MMQDCLQKQNISSSSSTGLDDKSPNFRSIHISLEVIAKNETELSRKAAVHQIALEFQQTGNPVVCKKLDLQSYRMLTQLRSHLKYFKFGFIELTNKVKEYEKYHDADIIQKLISFQDKINLEDFKTSYLTQLTVLKEKTPWTLKFIQEWVEKALHMQEKEIRLFVANKKEQKAIYESITSFKRSASQRTQTQTQAEQAPTKKIKKDSLNYQSILATMQCMIMHSEDQKKQYLQEKLSKYIQTDNQQYLHVHDQQLCRKLFDLRSYLRIFMDAYAQVTSKDQYKDFADKTMINKMIECQQLINPKKILGSYKEILESKRQVFNWPNEMVQEWLNKAVELRKIQVQTILSR